MAAGPGSTEESRSNSKRPKGEWWNPNGQNWPCCIIVMRHAEHTNGLVGRDGTDQIRDVSRSLAEWCHLTNTTPTAVEAYTTGDELGHEVVTTAHIMENQWRSAMKQFRPVDTNRRVLHLHPALAATYTPRDGCGDGNLRFIVLNEPQAGEFIDALTGLSIELQRGELMLLKQKRHVVRVGGPPFIATAPYRAQWTMAPHDPDGDPALKEIREKVASKMRTAGVLGGLITSLLTFVLTRLFTGSIRWGDAAFTALAALGVSATLFFVSMFFYDSLTMPARFWGQRARRSRWASARWRTLWRRLQNLLRSSDKADCDERASRKQPGWLLARPPSSTIRVLQLNMVRVWTWVFRPAILALGVGVVALLFALDRPSTTSDSAASITTVTPSTTAVAPTAADAPSTTSPAAATAAPPRTQEVAENGGVDISVAQWGILILTGIATGGWSIWFRPRLGASD